MTTITMAATAAANAAEKAATAATAAEKAATAATAAAKAAEKAAMVATEAATTMMSMTLAAQHVQQISYIKPFEGFNERSVLDTNTFLEECYGKMLEFVWIKNFHNYYDVWTLICVDAGEGKPMMCRNWFSVSVLPPPPFSEPDAICSFSKRSKRWMAVVEELQQQTINEETWEIVTEALDRTNVVVNDIYRHSPLFYNFALWFGDYAILDKYTFLVSYEKKKWECVWVKNFKNYENWSLVCLDSETPTICGKWVTSDSQEEFPRSPFDAVNATIIFKKSSKRWCAET